MRLVAVDTSTGLASVALFENGELIAEDVRHVTQHGESLLPAIDALFAREKWEPASIGRWAVDVGPGSFTGLRIGLATIRGVLFVTGAELVAVSSLDVLAHGLPPRDVNDVVVSLLGAGKGELFVKARKAGRVLVAPTYLRVGDVARAVQELEPGSRVVVAGEAASQVDWSSISREVELRVESPHDWPRASVVGRMALTADPVADVDALEPLYIRPPDITMPKPRVSPA